MCPPRPCATCPDCLRTSRRAAVTQRPDALYADRGYDHDKYRQASCEARVKPVIARRGEQHDSGLGVYRWVVEQGFALLHWFRRLRIRWENAGKSPKQSGASHCTIERRLRPVSLPTGKRQYPGANEVTCVK